MTAPGPGEQAPTPLPASTPRATQLRRLTITALAFLLIALAAFWFAQRSRVGSEGGAATPHDTFKPTAQQLKTFTIAPVATHSFASIEVADGRITVDADRATPVYTPFSGRIAVLHAGIGDPVAAGAALATIEASEFVQAQSDLAAGVAQLRLTEAALERKRALYEAQGASRQDLEQAQAEHATAAAACPG